MIAIGMPGTLEIVAISFVALLIFGRRLPSIAKGMGQSIWEFKRGLSQLKDVDRLVQDDPREEEISKVCEDNRRELQEKTDESTSKRSVSQHSG